MMKKGVRCRREQPFEVKSRDKEPLKCDLRRLQSDNVSTGSVPGQVLSPSIVFYNILHGRDI